MTAIAAKYSMGRVMTVSRFGAVARSAPVALRASRRGHSGTHCDNSTCSAPGQAAPFCSDPLETGHAEGKNVMIDYLSAEGQINRLPGLAAELVRRRVAVIITPGNRLGAEAAKAATSAIPIVFRT